MIICLKCQWVLSVNIVLAGLWAIPLLVSKTIPVTWWIHPLFSLQCLWIWPPHLIKRTALRGKASEWDRHRLLILNWQVLIFSDSSLLQGANEQEVKKRVRTGKQSRFRKNSLGLNGGVHFNKRSNGRIVPLIVVPKILKNDMRRQYPAIFRNLLNAADPLYFRAGLEKFYRHDCLFTHHVPTDISSSTGKPSKSFHGSASFADHYAGSTSSQPDFIMEIGPCTIRVRSNGTAELNFIYRMTCTQRWPVLEHVSLSPCIESTDEDSLAFQIISTEVPSNNQLGKIVETVSLSSAQPQFYSYQSNGICSMHLDDSSLVSSVQLSVTNIIHALNQV